MPESLMARILLCIHGDSLSSAFTAKELYEALGMHDLLVMATEFPYRLLHGKIPGLRKLVGFDALYKEKDEHISKTLSVLLDHFADLEKANLPKMRQAFALHKPELVISMGENFSIHYANRQGIPVLQFSSLSILSKGKFDVPLNRFNEYWESKIITEFFEEQADFWLIPSLGDVRVGQFRCKVTPPLVRGRTFELEPRLGSHFLVYQQRSLTKRQLKMMKGFHYEFRVYGSEGRSGRNIHFKQFHEDEFLQDLADCRAVLCDGSFSVNAEAICLGKPVLNLTPRKKFDLYINAELMKKQGFGEHAGSFDLNIFRSFLRSLPAYRRNLQATKLDNKAVIEVLKRTIGKLTKIEKKPQSEDEMTLTILKPDAIRKNIIGPILADFEKKSIQPVAMKTMRLTPALARKFYSDLEDRVPESVFKSLLDYMCSDKVLLIVWKGKHVINRVRKLCGPTDPAVASSDTIRGRYSDDDLEMEKSRGKAVKNIIHSSSNRRDSQREIGFFFKESEIL
jgi:uncharacterized protein (TIGR00661 family)